MEFVLTTQDIVLAPRRPGGQIILHLLKERGAPIDGTVWLKVRSGYKVTSFDNRWDYALVFRFDKL